MVTEGKAALRCPKYSTPYATKPTPHSPLPKAHAPPLIPHAPPFTSHATKPPPPPPILPKFHTSQMPRSTVHTSHPIPHILHTIPPPTPHTHHTPYPHLTPPPPTHTHTTHPALPLCCSPRDAGAPSPATTPPRAHPVTSSWTGRAWGATVLGPRRVPPPCCGGATNPVGAPALVATPAPSPATQVGAGHYLSINLNVL
jgi:hypothetical protein